MASKVILVTGGNKGIGLAIVETLLKQLPEALVLLGSRDAGRNLSISMSVTSFVCLSTSMISTTISQ